MLVMILLAAPVFATVYQVPSEYNYSAAYALASENDTINVSSGSIDAVVAKGIIIRAYNTSVSYLNITSSAKIFGINVTGGQYFGSKGTYNVDGYDKAAIFASGNNIYLEDVTITSIAGQNGGAKSAGSGGVRRCYNGAGGNGYGIYSTAAGLKTENLQITSISGGVGSSSARADSDDDDDCEGGIGGDAYGIYNSEGHMQIYNSQITTVRSGNGGNADADDGDASGGVNGYAYGIYTDDYTSVINSTITSVTGGTVGKAYNDDECDATNGRSARGSYAFYGDDYNLISNSTITTVQGGTGGQGDIDGGCDGDDDENGWDGGSGGFSYGIRTDRNAYVYGNTVSAITGGTGVNGGSGTGGECEDGGDGGSSGAVYAIRIAANSNTYDNIVYDLNGGVAGNGISDNGDGGNGGTASGLIALYCTGVGCDIYSNTVYDLEGSNGGVGGANTDDDCKDNGGSGGAGSSTYASYFTSNSNTYVYNNNFTDLNPGDGAAPGSNRRAGYRSYGGSGGSSYGMFSSSGAVGDITHYNNSMSDFTWGNRGCDKIQGTNRCDLNPDDFGNVIPLTNSSVTEPTPQTSQSEETGSTITINWYTTLDIYGTGTTGSALAVNYDLYHGDNSSVQTSSIGSATLSTDCSNIVCSKTWTYGAETGRAYIKVNSSTTTLTSAYTLEEVSKYYYILPYTFTVSAYPTSSPYRTSNLTCKAYITSTEVYAATGNVTWYKNGAYFSNQTGQSIALNSNVTISPQVNISDLTVDDVWNCSISVTDTVKSSSDSDTTTILNYRPTNPTDLQCNETTCPASKVDWFYINCNGSTDTENDTISYFIGAESPTMESLPNMTQVNNRLDIQFCSGISILQFRPDMSNFNFTSLTLTQYNVTATNVSTAGCLYNATCTYDCPINVTAYVSSSSSTHNITCNNTVLTTSPQVVYTGVNTSYFPFNCTMDYVNATGGYDFNLLFDIQ